MPDTKLSALTASTLGTAGLLYTVQGGADRKLSMSAAGAAMNEAADATAQAALLTTLLPLAGGTMTGALTVNNLMTLTPPSASESTLTIKDFTTGNKSVQLGTYSSGSGAYGIISFGNITPNGTNGTLWSNGSTITQLNTVAGGGIYITANAGTALMTIEGSATGKYFFSSTGGFGFTDALFYRTAAANMQLGASAASGWTSQILHAGGGRIGTDTNNSPTNTLTLAGSHSTGTGTGGDLRLGVYGTNGASGTAIGTLNTVLTIVAARKVVNISTIPTSSAGLSSGDVYSNAGILTIIA